MKMNRIGFILIIVIVVFMKSPSNLIGSIAKAEELPTISDGVYQVELSFQPHEEIQENFLNELATLKIEQGQYTLFVPILYGNILTVDTVKQQGEQIAYSLNQVENLVQFDVKSLQQSILFSGIMQMAEGEIPVHYSKQMTIEVKKLLDSINKNEDEETKDEENNDGGEEKDEETDKGNGEDKEDGKDEETDEENDDEIEDKPSPPAHEENIKEALLDYLLLVDGTNEPSIMNTYVNPTMKMMKKEGRTIAQMTILKSTWITGLKIEQGGEQIAFDTVSLVDNTRIIQFEVKDFSKEIQFWVQVDIPEIFYHHQYYVQLKWDEEQLALFLGEHIEQEPPKPTIPKPEIKKPEMSNPEAINPIKTPKEKLENIMKKSQASAKASKGMEKTAASSLEEETLSFNRALDEETEKMVDEPKQDEIEEEEIEQDVFEFISLDKMKIIFLVLACLLSGILFVYRIRKTKKDA